MRPSELLGVEEEYAAYCLDQAIAVLGNGITARLSSVDRDKKQMIREAKTERKMQRELAIILNLPEEISEKQYRTPGATKRR